MKSLAVQILSVFCVFFFSAAAIAGHEATGIKGTVTKIEAVEYEVTIKDDKGRETKVEIKGATDLKVGDSVVVRDGKIKKAVKPISGGY